MQNDQMRTEPERLMEDLLTLLPYWHGVIDKNIKQSLSGKMSLESYYCLQTLRLSGAITMSELAQRLRISRQQATQIIQRLYGYEFVRRIQDNADRRCVKIEITDRARDYIDQTFHHDAGFLEGLEHHIGRENIPKFAQAIALLLRLLAGTEDNKRK